MRPLKGTISDRIRRMLGTGEITPNDVQPVRPPEAPPKASSVRHAKGRGMGKGATRKRDGGGETTHG